MTVLSPQWYVLCWQNSIFILKQPPDAIPQGHLLSSLFSQSHGFPQPCHRLFHSLFARPSWQAFACHEGCARGLSVAFEKWQKFPSVIWSHNILQLTQYPLQIMLSQSIFRPGNHKEWCQPMGGHVPYPIPSTRLGLFNSLAMPSQCTGNQHNYTLGNHTINYLITLHISQ